MVASKGNENHKTRESARPVQINRNTIRNYWASSYQIPPALTRKRNVEAMLEQILIGEEKMRDNLC